MSRIEQKALKGKEPEYTYSRIVNGVLAIVQIYKDPMCVNVVSSKDRITKHCYPITEEQYKMYCIEALNWYHPDKELFMDLEEKYCIMAIREADENMVRFWIKTAMCYAKRSGSKVNVDNPYAAVPMAELKQELYSIYHKMNRFYDEEVYSCREYLTKVMYIVEAMSWGLL